MSEEDEKADDGGSNEEKRSAETDYTRISKKRRYLEQYTAEQKSMSSEDIISPTYKASAIIAEADLWDKNDDVEAWKDGETDSRNTNTSKININNSSRNSSDYSDAALKMMKGMGYETGKGLGREGQGITEPVKESLQKGHRGLGHHVQGFAPTSDEWVERPIATDVKVKWMPKPSLPFDPAFYRTPQVTLLVGARKETIADEIKFVSEQTLKSILDAKSVFDELPDKELREARTKANPFETIASVIFQNRAAMKMAELDALSGWAFSQKNKNYDSLPVIYFCDICAGPGGFSEYLLWRTQWHAKGFGLTLKEAPDASDFKLGKFLMGPPECFEPYYGVGGIDGDGDILKPENLDDFRTFVLKQTGSEGVHFVMGDGGICVEGKENIQEILSKQLLMCQIACALSVLRKDGNFACKTFDLFTPFSVGLVHVLRYAFEKVAIVKPLTSRPANSERYLLCMGCKKDTARQLYQYLFRLNMEIRKLSDTDQDILHVVPETHFSNDPEFLRYMTTSNEAIGDNQAYNLQKLRAYVKNQSLRVANQHEIREMCLQKWDVPNEMRKRRMRESPMGTAERFLNPTLFDGNPTEFSPSITSYLNSKHSWKCYLNYSTPLLLLGQGGKQVFYFDGQRSNWVKHPHITVDLPRDTIVEAQIVEIYDADGTRSFGLVITDAIVLGGQNVYSKAYLDRQAMIDKIVTSIKKESIKKRQEVFSLKSMLYRLENFKQMCSTLEKDNFKGSSPKLACSIKNRKFFVQGVTLIRHIKDPWNMELSTKLKKFYFYNNKTKESQYEWPVEAAADFRFTRSSSIVWRWDTSLWNQLLQLEPATDKLLSVLLSKAPHKSST